MANSFDKFQSKAAEIKDVPGEMLKKVEAELKPNEELKWYERANPAFFTVNSFPAFLFGIPFTAFSVFWVASAASGVKPSSGEWFAYVFPLFGLPFIFIGFSMLLAPVKEFMRLKRTIYAVTNTRAIIINKNSVLSYTPQSMTIMQKRIGRNGIGNIYFSQKITEDSDGIKIRRKEGFIGISQLNEVEKYLMELKNKAIYGK